MSELASMDKYGVDAAAFSIEEDVFDPRRSFFRRLLAHRAGAVALGFLLFLVIAALAAPLIPHFDPNAVNLEKTLAKPTWGHPLGYDNLGRNVLARIVFASRVSLLAAFEAVSVALAIGLPLGLVSGYFGKWIDVTISRTVECVMAIPPLLLAVVIVALLRPGLTSAMIAIGVVVSPNVFRLVRASTLEIRDETFVEAARSVGAPARRIFLRHILPNIRGPLLVQITLTMSQAIIVEASLSFIGLGVQLPQASWGSILRESSNVMASAPLVYVLSPGITIVLAVLSFNALGNALRDVFGAERHK